MKKLMITRGYPASGKSTWAREWVAKDPINRVEVNRDNVRALVNGLDSTSSEIELFVTRIVNEQLKFAADNNKDIVISDTNLREKYIKTWIRWADANGYTIRLIDFIISEADIINRNATRTDKNPIPTEVLRTIMKKFPVSRWLSLDELRARMEKGASGLQPVEMLPYRNDPTLTEALLVDIDGTLAHHKGIRDPFDVSKVGLDLPDETVISVVKQYHHLGVRIVVMSGRPDSCKTETLQWLEKHKVPFDELHMRVSDDRRPDWQVKDELVRTHIENNYHILFCLDDRNQVVDHYRANGYKVFQVEPGDF